MPIQRRNADLTSFAALLGDSFASKIDLLAQIIQERHYPSLGRYKERLLANTIAEFLPKDYEVGTGFVLFVHDATPERAKKPGFDALNMGSYSISKQCDLLVFESAKTPVVFRDGDFVIVRPESVRALIEVKGTANAKSISEALKSLFDFGQKWHQCQLFYHEHNQSLTRNPSLYVMCWDVGKARNGRPIVDGTKIGKQIAGFYRDNMKLGELKGFPRLNKLLLYNICEVAEIGYASPDATGFEIGFCQESGSSCVMMKVGGPLEEATELLQVFWQAYITPYARTSTAFTPMLTRLGSLVPTKKIG